MDEPDWNKTIVKHKKFAFRDLKTILARHFILLMAKISGNTLKRSYYPNQNLPDFNKNGFFQFFEKRLLVFAQKKPYTIETPDNRQVEEAKPS
jgi:hypothetical protein